MLVQNFGLPTNDFYEALAWRGLKEHNVKAWVDLSQEKKDALKNEDLKIGYLTGGCPQ